MSIRPHEIQIPRLIRPMTSHCERSTANQYLPDTTNICTLEKQIMQARLAEFFFSPSFPLQRRVSHYLRLMSSIQHLTGIIRSTPKLVPDLSSTLRRILSGKTCVSLTTAFWIPSSGSRTLGNWPGQLSLCGIYSHFWFVCESVCAEYQSCDCRQEHTCGCQDKPN
jgi:hypothetical protein